ncbi:hypothetical protein K492DRAFT_77645 [Lichtheimia hyalospora FSU 10163]|nr:hypothetical protein K492DRAFT_77645 [Lichtheimia hyalospora FSU 10163]
MSPPQPHSQKSGGGSKAPTKKDASRIQSHADRTQTNQDFKRRMQSTADKAQGQDQSSKGEHVSTGAGQTNNQ